MAQTSASAASAAPPEPADGNEPTSTGRERRGSRRSRMRVLVSAIAVFVVLFGAAIAAVSVSFRYLHAVELSTDGGGWLPPDGALARDVRAGPYSAAVIAPRPGHQQTFEMDLVNGSPVSQTVLGLTDGKDIGNPRTKAEPVHLQVSKNRYFPPSGRLVYTSRPVTIPPGGQYKLRFIVDTANYWSGCRSESWPSLSLQVRVGWFTRTESFNLQTVVIPEIRSSGKHC